VNAVMILRVDYYLLRKDVYSVELVVIWLGERRERLHFLIKLHAEFVQKKYNFIGALIWR
jgi:hypothetical protein